jgi:hypothetical protein
MVKVAVLTRANLLFLGHRNTPDLNLSWWRIICSSLRTRCINMAVAGKAEKVGVQVELELGVPASVYQSRLVESWEPSAMPVSPLPFFFLL